MPKISINLLPLEFKEQDLKNTKFYRIQTFGVATVLLMVFLASATVALRYLQSQNITKIQSDLAKSEQKISELKTTQASLYVLKDRLTTINQYLGSPSNQSQIYRLIVRLLPQGVVLNSLSVSKASEAQILVTLPDGNSIDNLINNLTAKENNEGKISQVSIENINRGIDGIYRLSLKIKTKLE